MEQESKGGGGLKAVSLRLLIARVALDGDLNLPLGAQGIVLFAHGSGSSRQSPRNRYVADVLNQAGFATFLLDLLTQNEETADLKGGTFRFNIPLLAERLTGAIDWLKKNSDTAKLPIGVFGASTGAAAALIAAAGRPEHIRAVVSRGGRPDLAKDKLAEVKAPTLLIVGGNDPEVLELNRDALTRLKGEKKLEVVPGATHLFEEPGTLEQVAKLATSWFLEHLRLDKQLDLAL
ncbi:MAG: alpha/beta family hydrolase [Chloroflexota bacterium]